jgi:hypothetical protein
MEGAVARQKRRAPKRAKKKAEKPGVAAPPNGAPARKLYSVGEVVKASGISRQVLHNYTVLGLLRPAERTPTNRRYYDESVFRRVKLIRRMLGTGYTLQDLREVFPWED